MNGWMNETWLGWCVHQAHLHADGVVDLDLTSLLALALLLLQLLVPCARLQRPYQPPPIQFPASQTSPCSNPVHQMALEVRYPL